ncbi:MAG: hypothetical protein R6T83_12420 [Salinibacter sp.]
MTPRQQSILVGAVVTGILSTSYLSFINVLCCLGVMIGGAVAAQQYTTRASAAGKRPVLNAADGAVLGSLAGVGGAVLGPLFDWGLRPLGLDSQTISQGMMEQWMEGMDGQQMSPEMMEQVQGDGTTLMFLGGMLFNIVLYSIFGAIGGAIGAALFGEDEADGGGGVQTTEAEVLE